MFIFHLFTLSFIFFLLLWYLLSFFCFLIISFCFYFLSLFIITATFPLIILWSSCLNNPSGWCRCGITYLLFHTPQSMKNLKSLKYITSMKYDCDISITVVNGLKVLIINNVSTSCSYMLSLSLIRSKNKALKKLHFKSIIKCFKEVRRIENWLDLL